MKYSKLTKGKIKKMERSLLGLLTSSFTLEMVISSEKHCAFHEKHCTFHCTFHYKWTSWFSCIFD